MGVVFWMTTAWLLLMHEKKIDSPCFSLARTVSYFWYFIYLQNDRNRATQIGTFHLHGEVLKRCFLDLKFYAPQEIGLSNPHIPPDLHVRNFLARYQIINLRPWGFQVGSNFRYCADFVSCKRNMWCAHLQFLPVDRRLVYWGFFYLSRLSFSLS